MSERSDLAVAALAAETGSGPERAPRRRRLSGFLRRFDERAYRAGLERSGIRFVARSAAEFPPLLRAIHDPPPGLFIRGPAEVELLRRPAVALVGARACSPYGSHVARMLARELAAAGVVVVSGLARGVDAAAHRGALDADGATVAVLGCGIDRVYPSSHTALASEICRRGVLVAEYPPGVEPAPWRFPARNRIIAGLTSATVVVEARERSGALITADLALEEGRDVFAVPGEITSRLSEGTNALLRLGATPCTSSDDVLETLGIETAQARDATELGETATLVLDQLREHPASADELVRSTGLASGVVAAALSELELGGLVEQADGLFRAGAQ